MTRQVGQVSNLPVHAGKLETCPTMTRVLALCSAADHTGSVKQFDLALPLLRGRFDVVRHALPADVPGLINEVKPALVHTLGAEAFRAVRKAALMRVKLPPWLASGAAAVEPLLDLAPGLTATFSQSEHERDWAARLVPAPMQFSGPIGVVSSPRADDSKSARSQARGEHLGKLTILACGGFDNVANLKHVVWAFDVLKYAHPQLHLLLFGDGPQRPDIERFASTLGFDDLRIHCVGFEHDITPYLQQAVQAWGSHTHGGVKFLLEAMASGVPVIATRTADSERLIRDGANGLLVPADRPVEMARAAHALLASPERAGTLVVAGQTTAVGYSVADLAEALTGAYYSLTSSDSPRSE
jgi:hypothetical protein